MFILDPVFTALWVLFGVSFLVIEGIAIHRGPRTGDTLSEHVWWVLARGWGRILIYPLWAWLTWHFFFEPWFGYDDVIYDDLIAVLTGLVIAFIVNRVVAARKAEEGEL